MVVAVVGVVRGVGVVTGAGLLAIVVLSDISGHHTFARDSSPRPQDF